MNLELKQNFRWDKGLHTYTCTNYSLSEKNIHLSVFISSHLPSSSVGRPSSSLGSSTSVISANAILPTFSTRWSRPPWVLQHD